jgi:hypothetical protein
MTTRRAFIATLAGGLLAAPVATEGHAWVLNDSLPAR